jgi:hypothetical protein
MAPKRKAAAKSGLPKPKATGSGLPKPKATGKAAQDTVPTSTAPASASTGSVSAIASADEGGDSALTGGLKHNPKIVSILMSVDMGDGEQRVKAAETILHILEHEDKVAWRQHIHPRQVGVDPANRGGQGLHGDHVHGLCSDFVGMGFAWLAVVGALCIEDDDLRSVALFTDSLSKSDERIPSWPDGAIRYGSLACSHTNAALWAIISGHASDDDRLTIDGKMSKDKLSLQDPDGFGKALSTGLSWLILPKDTHDKNTSFICAQRGQLI